jgi:hypothetical protein
MVIVERQIVCDVTKWSIGYRGTYYDPPEPPEPEDYTFNWEDTGEELSDKEYKLFEKQCEEALNDCDVTKWSIGYS